MMSEDMTMMHEVINEARTDIREGQELLELLKHNKIIPIDVLEGYRGALVEISSLANAVSEHAAAVRTNIDIALEQ